MKKLLLFLVCLLIGVSNISATIKTSTDSLSFKILNPDSLGNPMGGLDTIKIIVTRNGDSLFTEVINGVAGRISSRSTGAGKYDTTYYFECLVSDIDGAGAIGDYTISAMAISNETGAWLRFPSNKDFQLVSTNFDLTLENMSDSLEALSVALEAVRDSQQYTVTATGFATLTNQNLIIDSLNKVLDRTYTLLYDNAIWVDAGGANTNTVKGVDGIPSNPVSTLTAARTLADNIGIQKYYIMNSSSFTLSATHEDWEFVGKGVNNTLNLGSQDVDGSYFFNMVMTGSKGGTGDVTMENCVINDLLLMDGFLFHCGIMGTNSIASSDDVFLMNCFSMVAGNGTPVWDFGSGICELSVRNYSGGIEITNMDGNDGASIESDGQVVMNINCTNANVTVRGMMTLTDNDGGTVWTRDAVFSRQEVFAIQADSVWSKDTTGLLVAGTYGLEATTGGSASITSADMGAIADSVWYKDTTNAFAGTISVGQFVKDSSAQTSASSGISDLDMGSIADSVWQRDTTISTANSYGVLLKDTSAYQSDGGGGSDTTAIKTMVHNNFLPYSGSNNRYVSPDGDNSDGLTWLTAWTTPDSITNITTGTNYMVYIDGADYDPVWACTVKVDYLSMIGVNGMPTFHYNTDTLSTGQWDGTGGVDVGECIYVDSLVDYGTIENIRFTGEGLYAYPYYGRDPDAFHANPDSVLSTANVGGKNAITFQMRANHWAVKDCVFDSLYKPIIAIYVDDMIDSSIYGHTYENNTFRDVEYHAFDGAWAYSIFRNNTMIKTDVSNHPSAGAVQLISRIGAYNMVYDNYIHGFGYALYANVSDSNFFANNYLGAEIIADGSGSAYRSYDTGYTAPHNWFVGNVYEGGFAPRDGFGNIVNNSGFEYPSENIHHVPFWGSNDWSVANKDDGVDIEIVPFGYQNFTVDAEYSNYGGEKGYSLFLMAGLTDGHIYQNTNVFHLDAGEAQFDMKVLPNTPIIPLDTVRVMLYEDTNLDKSYSALASEVYYYESDGGSNWENLSNVFTILNAGNYYMSIATWNVDSGDGFYYDDVFLGQYAGNVVATANLTTGNIQDIASEVNDTLKAEHGDSDWGATGSGGSGAVQIRVEVTDTTGTDSLLVADVSVTIRKMTNALDAVLATGSDGIVNFTLPAEQLIFSAYKTGYLFFTDTITVSVQDTVFLFGNDIFKPPTPPSGEDLCTVYGWVRNYKTLAKRNYDIKIVDPQDATWNICDSTILAPETHSISIDDTGYFHIDLLKSSCMETNNNGSLRQYKISIPGLRNTEHKFSIPSDSTTYRMVF